MDYLTARQDDGSPVEPPPSPPNGWVDAGNVPAPQAEANGASDYDAFGHDWVPPLNVTTGKQTWDLEPGRTYVCGRGADADIVIDRDSVSRRHFSLDADDGYWVVRDLGSTNGIYFDDQRVTEWAVTGPTQLRLGESSGDQVVVATPQGTVFEDFPEDATVHSGGGTELPTPPPPPVEDVFDQEPLYSSFDVAPVWDVAGHVHPFDPSAPLLPAVDDTTRLASDDGSSPRGSVLDYDARGRQRTLTSGSSQRYVTGFFDSRMSTEGVIGRSASATISVTDPLVSRQHAHLQVTADGIVLSDLRSSNGTFVNGRRVREVWLVEGDLVTVGNTDLVLNNGVLAAKVRENVEAPSLVASGVELVLPGGKRLLDGISVGLNQGSLTAIVGPSGAGKSTFAKVISGLASPTGGKVYLDGFDIHENYEILRSRIGFVPQDDVVHGLLTVDQAMRSTAKLRLPGATLADREATIDRVLNELELDQHRSTRIDRLSGGQRKRVSTAIELLTGPELLLLDEPTSGLDPALDLTVMQMLRRLADAGRVVVVVTHSVAQLESTCDNLLFLAPGGKTAYWGPVAGVQEAYGEQDWAEIFANVAANPTLAHAQHLSRAGMELPHAMPVKTVTEIPKRASKHHWSQGKTLIGRQIRLTIADPGLLVFLLGLPLILGGLALVVPGDAGFGVAQVDSPSEANNLLVLLILGAAFMGAALSVRDLVGERHIYHRERAAGLSSVAYVASKFLILGALTAIQAVELTLVVGLGKDTPGEGALLSSQWVELGIVVWLTAWSSAMLGLLASALVQTGEQTMPVLVVLVMVQLVMTGGMIPVTDRAGLEQLSWLVPSRWGFAAGASTIDLREAVPGVPEEALWQATTSQWLTNSAIVLAMIVILTFLTWWNVRLKKGSRAL